MVEKPVSERALVAVVTLVQFINVLDFMMVMPLGPDFARALGIPTSHLGYIGGSYTAAAMLAGLAGSLFLDKLGRRQALTVAMAGLAVGTAAGGFATGLASLMTARIVAGAFGGPATSVSVSIIADVIPVERRGKALGAVMAAFSVSSVLGVPFGLKLAEVGGWRAPFFAVAALGVLVTAVTALVLPPLRGHLTPQAPRVEPSGDDRSYRASPRMVPGDPPVSTAALLARPTVIASYAMTAVTMMGGFALIPNISGYVQMNLGYPRSKIGLLYFAGGMMSFVVLPLAGRLVDRFGSLAIALPATASLVAVIYGGFVAWPPWFAPPVMFVLFMSSTGFRNVAYHTLVTRVPGPAERARFMSVQSAVQHGASSLGAVMSTWLLREEGGRLVGMGRVAGLAMAMMACVPPLMAAVERRLRAERGEGAVTDAP